jgi:hypothetical protein
MFSSGIADSVTKSCLFYFSCGLGSGKHNLVRVKELGNLTEQIGVRSQDTKALRSWPWTVRHRDPDEDHQGSVAGNE